MPLIDRTTVTPNDRSVYPEPYNLGSGHFKAWPMSDAGGISQFGAALETLNAGAMSSQRHWHENSDEFLYMLSGELILVEDEGESTLRTGDAAGWKAGTPNGHHLHNRSTAPATFLIVGRRVQNDTCHYPDIDLVLHSEGDTDRFSHKDGTPYPPKKGE